MALSRRTALSVLGLGSAGIVSGEDLSKPLSEQFGSSGQAGYRFGLDYKRTVGALRRLADDIEAGGTFPQELSLTSKISPSPIR
jgi:hypothetical protein